MDNTHNLSIAILHLQNEVNIGGIIRTANAAALNEVIIIGRKKWNKSSATGAQKFTPVRRIKTLDEFIEYCKTKNYNIISIEIDERAKNIFDYNYPENTILLIGNEGSGLPKKILDISKDIICIPQYGNMECLNAATSADIVIYDWIRKNSKLKPRPINNSKFI